METNDKLELLRYLIFIRGKLQHLSIELLTMGEDTTQVDNAEQKLADDIQMLRGQVMAQWQGDAQVVLGQLRNLNEKAQDKIREMRAAVDKAQKITDFVGILDQGLALVAKLVA